MNNDEIMRDAQYYSDYLDNKYGYVAQSHLVLGKLYVKHGREAFNKALEAQWKKEK